MMEKLIARGEQLVAQAQQRQVQRVAQQLRMLFGSAAVENDADRVVVVAGGLLKRWLVDPTLRFFMGTLK